MSASKVNKIDSPRSQQAIYKVGVFKTLHYTVQQEHSEKLPTASCHDKQLGTVANPCCDSVQAHGVFAFHHRCPLKPPKDQFSRQIFHREQRRRAGRLRQLYFFIIFFF